MLTIYVNNQTYVVLFALKSTEASVSLNVICCLQESVPEKLKALRSSHCAYLIKQRNFIKTSIINVKTNENKTQTPVLLVRVWKLPFSVDVQYKYSNLTQITETVTARKNVTKIKFYVPITRSCWSLLPQPDEEKRSVKCHGGLYRASYISNRDETRRLVSPARLCQRL